MSAIKPFENLHDEAFRAELTNQQLNCLMSMLPAGYSLQLEPKNKKKEVKMQSQSQSKKKNTKDNQPVHKEEVSAFSVQASQQQQLPTKGQKKPVAKSTPVVEKPQPAQNKQTNLKWMDNLEEPLKKCARILGLLKSSKYSWPFHEPVNADQLGIPEYFQIIKEPMDLLTIEQKLKNGKYSDFEGFQADVLKIIENSYRFNEANEEFLKITNEFQSYFCKISAQPQQQEKNVNKNNKKKKKSTTVNKDLSDTGPITLLEKKQLAQQIRRLGKQHIKSIAGIVFDNKQEHGDCFDLQKISHKKLRQLQKFIRGKIIAMEEKVRANQHEKNQPTDLDLLDSDESPFLSDQQLAA